MGYPGGLLPCEPPSFLTTTPASQLAPPLLFSVQITDAVISSPSLVLSAIRIPIQWCQPEVQRTHRVHRLSRRRSVRTLALWSLFAISRVDVAYSLPGTPHMLIPTASLDSTRQNQLRDTVIANTATTSPPQAFPSVDAANSPITDAIPTTPFCFVADTDSARFTLDTGANRIIVNDVKLLDDFQSVSGDVKGIGGTPVAIKGVGTCRIPLPCDDGSYNTIPIHDAVYVPSSPFNLIPPQLLIQQMKALNYRIQTFSHDDKNYWIKYSAPGDATHSSKTLTVSLDNRKLFTFWTSPGYHSFFRSNHCHKSPWPAFSGAAHVIPDNDIDSLPDTTPHSGELPPL